MNFEIFYFFRSKDLLLTGSLRLLMVLLIAIVGVACMQGQVVAQGFNLFSTKQITDESEEKSEPGIIRELETAVSTEVEANEGDIDHYAERALEARESARGLLENAPEIDDAVLRTLRSKTPDHGLGWISTTLLKVAGAIIAGLLAYRLVLLWGRGYFSFFRHQGQQRRADKITFLFLRALLMAAGLAVFFGVAGLALLLVNTGFEASHQTGVVVLLVATLFLFLRVVFLNLIAPDVPEYRLFDLADRDARALYRSLMAAAAVAAIAFAFTQWMERLGLPADARKLAKIGAAFLSAALLSVIAVAFKGVIGDLIRGASGAQAPLWRRVVASAWHLVAVGYFLVAWALSSIRILLDLPDATGLVVAPLQVLLISAVVYGILVLIIDRLLLPRLDSTQATAALEEDILRAEQLDGEEPNLAATAAQARAEAGEREAQRAPFRDLLDHGASILVLFFALSLLMRFWGIAIAQEESVVGSVIQVLLVIFLGYMAYKAVEVAIDRQMAKEGPVEKDAEAEIGGTGESRIATLLPIFRNFLLITIVVIAAMVVLSELGVNIGPLFAGAGVVGLAIGFGAQTLIRDIFSGAFYLLDDAFRKGEYIDIGSAKGVVEKISIRSMQLRHHRGALTTIPFGEIQHVENFSRDWAMMKLAFRVTYDTDVEKMRKIIKKFGQELMEDEYYGPMFLQPLKSQGILAMEDSAMIARVKFMTKPGKQFELRKVVYAGLQDLFEKNGIKFAHKQVTVRVATDGDEETAGAEPKPVSEQARRAAAGAAAAGLIDGDEGAVASGDVL